MWIEDQLVVITGLDRPIITIVVEVIKHQSGRSLRLVVDILLLVLSHMRSISILRVASKIPGKTLVVYNVLWLKFHIGMIGGIRVLPAIILGGQPIGNLVLWVLRHLVSVLLSVPVLSLRDLSLLIPGLAITVLLYLLIAWSLVRVGQEVLLATREHSGVLAAAAVAFSNVVVRVVAIAVGVVVIAIIIVSNRIRR